MADASHLRAWPATAVALVRLEGIHPYSRNARLHSDQQVRQIADSMLRWGVTVPVLVDEAGVLIYGHGRLRAAQLLVSEGHERFGELPAVVARGWTEEEKNAYRIADNQLTLLSEWDIPTLKSELGSLKLGGFDMPLLGFDNAQLIKFTDTFAGKDPDETPEAPDQPISQPGDLWLLGKHRLLCGDATKAQDVECLLAGAKPHLMVTDPPYGVDYDPAWRGRVLKDGATRAEGRVTNDQRVDWSEAWQLFFGDVAYIWHEPKIDMRQDLQRLGFQIRAQIVWAKSRLVLGRGDYHVQHEPCWYAVRSTSHWNGDRTQTTLWQIDHRKSETGHSAQKPVECMRRPIENNSLPDEAVYDPFVGSGTTIVAAEMTARRCFAIEIEPAYCDVAIRRWQKFTDQIARRERDGLAFDSAQDGDVVERQRNFNLPSHSFE